MNQIARISARIPQPPSIKMEPAQWRVLTDAIFPSAKSAEAIALAIDYCTARRLDIFKRPVHIVPMWNSTLGKQVETVWPGINELQVTASRTGQWAGMESPEWGEVKTRTFRGETGKDRDKKKVEITLEYPEWCSVTVYRMVGGVKCGFAEPVYWEESYATQNRWSELPNEIWQKRVRGQLHKNAKAAALRAAFPEEMGNDYSAEEMEGRETDGGIVIEGQAEEPTPPPPPPPLPRTKASAKAKEAPPEREPEPPIGEPDVHPLDNEPLGNNWLKVLRNALAGATTLDGLAALRALTSVREAEKSAPTAIQGIIADQFAEAAERLMPPREEAPPTIDADLEPPIGMFDDDPAAVGEVDEEIIAQVEHQISKLGTSAAIMAWAKGPIRATMLDLKARNPDAFTRASAIIDVKMSEVRMAEVSA